MWPDIVVVVAPQGPFATGIGQAVDYLLVEAFIAQAAVEALEVTVLLRLARVVAMPLDLVVVRALQDRLAGEFGAIVTDEASSFSIDAKPRVQVPCDPRLRCWCRQSWRGFPGSNRR